MILVLLSHSTWGQQIEYTKADSTKIVGLLANAVKERGNESRMLYFGKKFLGVPYVGHTLENGDHEHLIVNTRELDCTTFVETVLSLALCDKENKRTFSDYCRNLTKIRYRGGKLTDYTSRLHYFTWWGEDNESLGIVKSISRPGAPYTAVQTINVHYMTSHPDYYKQLKLHPEFISVIGKQERESNGNQYRYIPKSLLNGSRTDLADIHDGDIISILTSKDGLDTSHIGIAFWQGGKLHLMHASSLQKKVVMDQNTFYDYSQGQKSHIGIRVYRAIETMRE